VRHATALGDAQQAEAVAPHASELRDAERPENVSREADEREAIAPEVPPQAGRPNEEAEHDALQRDARQRAAVRRAAQLHAAEQREADNRHPSPREPLVPNRDLGELELRELDLREREPGEPGSGEHRYFSLSSPRRAPRGPDLGDRRRRAYRNEPSAPTSLAPHSAPTAVSSTVPDSPAWPDAPERERVLRARVRDIARTQPEWGHRLAWGALLHEGWQVDRKEIRALWRAEGLPGPGHQAVGPRAIGSFTRTTDPRDDGAREDDERAPRSPPATTTT